MSLGLMLVWAVLGCAGGVDGRDAVEVDEDLTDVMRGLVADLAYQYVLLCAGAVVVPVWEPADAEVDGGDDVGVRV